MNFFKNKRLKALILELIEGDNEVNYLEDIAGEVVDVLGDAK
ncbi:hypothetical protein [Mucilaginibacter sp.]